MAMSSAERVRRSRWANRVEETADQLLDLLKQAPYPLHRDPVIEPELVALLAPFTMAADELDEEEYPKVKFLEPGNGHQTSNRRRAMRATEKLVAEAVAINENTIRYGQLGECHFMAFTHPKGAMISSTRIDDVEFGNVDWHEKENVVMFRDVGDGRCIVYVSPIEPLFGLRTIGHHGVKWEDVRRTASQIKVLRSADAIAASGP